MRVEQIILGKVFKIVTKVFPNKTICSRQKYYKRQSSVKFTEVSSDLLSDLGIAALDKHLCLTVTCS